MLSRREGEGDGEREREGEKRKGADTGVVKRIRKEKTKRLQDVDTLEYNSVKLVHCYSSVAYMLTIHYANM